MGGLGCVWFVWFERNGRRKKKKKERKRKGKEREDFNLFVWLVGKIKSKLEKKGESVGRESRAQKIEKIHP